MQVALWRPRSEKSHRTSGLTKKRARQIVTIVSPYLPDSEALNERSESAHANPIGMGFSLLSADFDIRSYRLDEVEDDYRSELSSTRLPREEGYPLDLYTVIAHNGSLRTHIQSHLDELGEFKEHVRCAQFLISGWLVTLCHLMLVVIWNTLVCAFIDSLGQNLQRL